MVDDLSGSDNGDEKPEVDIDLQDEDHLDNKREGVKKREPIHPPQGFCEIWANES